MKRNISLAFMVILTLILSACGTVDMDQLSTDGNYHYKNEDLGFSVILPPEFIYYQTQRESFIGYTELQFFVPTSDPRYTDARPSSYAQPLVVRVYDEKAYDGIQDLEEKDTNRLAGRKNGKVVTVRFWSEPPQDWQAKWSDQMRDAIQGSVKTL